MFEKLGLFHTPEDWAELQDKIEAHGSGERMVATLFAAMGWNLAIHLFEKAGSEHTRPSGLMPEKLNSYPVLAKAPYHGRIGGDYAVLVRRDDNSLHPYVVAHWNKDAKTNWNWGNYFETYEQALECFIQKSSKDKTEAKTG